MRHIPLAPLWSDLSDPELDTLLHPASAFDHPRDVVRDLDLTLEEKHAILSSWASDACAVESQPALRRPQGAKQPVEFDDIVDALRSLVNGPPKWKCVVGRGRSGSNESPNGGNAFLCLTPLPNNPGWLTVRPGLRVADVPSEFVCDRVTNEARALLLSAHQGWQ
jgi:hypothetical protein